jgi:hypothetical protein
MVTGIVSNSGKGNEKPFRINAGADNFYVILHLSAAKLMKPLSVTPTKNIPKRLTQKHF